MEEKEYFFIEREAKDDLIGFNSYIDSLDQAINSGANFIGLISDYGTGKSTLLDMYKTKKCNEKDILVKINLWNCDNYSNNEQKKIESLCSIRTNTDGANFEKPYMDIHRLFLHQLIDGLSLDNPNYYKKKINRNYNVFDIKLGFKRYIYFYFLAIFLIMSMLDKLGIFTMFMNCLEPLGYFLISVLTVLCILLYKPAISYKNADGPNREIDENDTKDLYREIIEAYRIGKNRKKSRIIICLEELDRYDNMEVILEYLKEFYKFYKEQQNVVFIISIKSASQIIKSLNDREISSFNVPDIKELYEKIFDFILNLKPINIHDYDSIVAELLSSKINNVPEGITIPTLNNLRNWKYLYKGTNIKIRDIKHRYNFAIALYLTLSDSELKPNINKCLFLAYLEDAHNELYDKLVSDNDLLNSVLINYANKIRDFEFLGFTNDENEILLEGLDSKFITVDYNHYFYKFPKGKKCLSPYEFEVYNAIFFDEDNNDLNLFLEKLTNAQLLNLIDKRVNELFLPKIVFKYPKLLLVAYSKRNDVFTSTLSKQFDLISNFEHFKFYLSCIQKTNNSTYIELLRFYFQIHLDSINELDVDERYSLRRQIVSLIKNDTFIIKELFYDDNLLISSEEIDNISDPKILYELIDSNKTNDDFVSQLYDVISKFDNIDNKTLLKFIEIAAISSGVTESEFRDFFYSFDFKKYNFTEKQYRMLLDFACKKIIFKSPTDFYYFVNMVGYYCQYYDSFYLDLLEDNYGKKEIEEYASIVDRYKKIYKNGMRFLNNYAIENRYFPFCEEICERFYEHKFYNYYVVATYLRNKTFTIEKDRLNILKDYYIFEFEHLNSKVICYDQESIDFLFTNVNFSKLNISALNVFRFHEQNYDLIEAVLNINNSVFVNSYLSTIPSFVHGDEKSVYELLGKYNKEIGLTQSAKRNLKKIVSDESLLYMLDARKFKVR